MNLLKNQTTNTDGSQESFLWNKGSGANTRRQTIICEGTFDGCTITVEGSIDGGEWVSCGSDSEFTSAGIVTIELSNHFSVRGTLTSAGGSTDITLKIV